MKRIRTVKRAKALNLGAHAIHLYLGLRDKCENIFPTETTQTEAGEVKLAADAALVEIWGQGGIEFSQFLADVAVDIDTICRRSYKILSDEEDGFPGVFEYEVNEPVGADIAVWLKENQEYTMDALKALAEDSLLRHARTFLHQCDDMPTRRLLDEALDQALPAAAKRLSDWVEQRDAETQKEASIIEVGAAVFTVVGTTLSHGKVASLVWRTGTQDGKAPDPAALVHVQLDSGQTQAVTLYSVFPNQAAAVCALNRNLDAQQTK